MSKAAPRIFGKGALVGVLATAATGVLRSATWITRRLAKTSQNTRKHS